MGAAPQIVDWNGDGLKDLLVGETTGTVRYYANIGTGGNPVLTYNGLLTVGGDILDVGSLSIPWVNDWNEDGLIDLLVGSGDGLIRLYINVGTSANPTFDSTQYVELASGAQLDVGWRSCPNVVDLNWDGVKDLISGEVYGKIYYYQNNGTNANPQLADGVFLMVGDLEMSTSGTSRPTPIDWDANGVMDLVIGSQDPRLERFMWTSYTPPAPTCDLTPIGSIAIPASGGMLNYTFTADNPSSQTVTFDAWTDVKLPSIVGWNGPLLVRTGISLGPESNLSRDMSQNIPYRVSAGYYSYHGYLGIYSNLQVYSHDEFEFIKLYSSSGPTIDDWMAEGWEEAYPNNAEGYTPEEVILSAAPNPFNIETIISFGLPQAAQVNLSIYNLMGRQVATLVSGYRVPGWYQVTFDASKLPSGLYIYRLTTDDQSCRGKVLLLK